MATNQPFRRALQENLDDQYRRFLNLLWWNGALSSRERIIAFLVNAAEIMPTEPQPDGSIVLSMQTDRSDWADLTNTTVETICRTVRYLEEKRLITSLSPYRFQIHNLDALARLAGVDPPSMRMNNQTR
jgi:CRP-like cAMP-binding protein